MSEPSVTMMEEKCEIHGDLHELLSLLISCLHLSFSLKYRTWQALRWHILELLLWWTTYNRDIESPCNSHMRREHVFTKCTQCGWRQRSHTIGGKICFDEYYCKRCGGQLLICVRIQRTKGKQNMLSPVIREIRTYYVLRMGGYWVAFWTTSIWISSGERFSLIPLPHSCNRSKLGLKTSPLGTLTMASWLLNGCDRHLVQKTAKTDGTSSQGWNCKTKTKMGTTRAVPISCGWRWKTQAKKQGKMGGTWSDKPHDTWLSSALQTKWNN